VGWSCDKELESEMKDYNQIALEFLQGWVNSDVQPNWAMTITLERLLRDIAFDTASSIHDSLRKVIDEI